MEINNGRKDQEQDRPVSVLFLDLGIQEGQFSDSKNDEFTNLLKKYMIVVLEIQNVSLNFDQGKRRHFRTITLSIRDPKDLNLNVKQLFTAIEICGDQVSDWFDIRILNRDDLKHLV